MLYEKLLLPKTVQLVTFIVKDYVTCKFTWNDLWTSIQRVPAVRFNNIFDRHATYCYSYDVGELSNSQKKAIILLLEKKDKDKRHISNWRPISLINVDVKIGSKAIAKRLAFDSVSREFLFRTLSAACFGSSFIQWIDTFYNNIYSCVSNNGFARLRGILFLRTSLLSC